MKVQNTSHKWLNQGMIFRPHRSYSDASAMLYAAHCMLLMDGSLPAATPHFQ